MDNIVDRAICYQLSKLKAADSEAIIRQAHESHLDLKRTQLANLKKQLTDKQKELAEAEQAAEAEIEEYKQLSDWASLYKQCSFEAKKMIVSRLVKSVHVYREYHIDMEFNVSFEEFRQLEIDGKSLPADPAQGIEKQA